MKDMGRIACKTVREKHDMSKVAVITGGSRGLGLSLARCVAREGFTPILLARNTDALEEAVAEIANMGSQAVSYAVDITDETAMGDVAGDIAGRFGTVDFLINNAGILHTDILENMSINDIQYDLEVCLFGTILSTRLCIPMMEKGGRILFISSGFGLMGPAGYSVYAAAKAGMINFADAIRRELHARKIGVHVAVPSDIDTPGLKKELAGLPAWMKVSQARGKIQSPDDAARRILQKCSGNRFLIFTDPGVRMLHMVNKLLPHRLRDVILDMMFPRP